MDTFLLALILFLPLAAAVLAVALGRWPKVASATGTVAAALVWLALLASGLAEASPALDLLGRSLTLAPYARGVLMLYAGALVVLCLLSLLWPEHRTMAPAGLAAFSALALALLSPSFSLGAVALLAAVAFAVPAVYAGRFNAAAAAWRYFLLSALAVPLLLLADWLLSSGQPSGTMARLCLAGASLLLLGGFPFSLWVTGIARESRPLALALVGGLVSGAVALFVLSVVEAFPLVRTSSEFQLAVRWSAALTALLAALMMLRARSWAELAGYALLLDMGFLLLALVMPVEAARQTALMAWAARIAALFLLAAGLHWAGGRGARLPWRTLVLLYACLSLIGLPFTPAFPARWAELSAALPAGASGAFPWVPALLALALSMSMAAALRLALKQEPEAEARAETSALPGTAVAVLALAMALMGILPQLLLEYALRLARL